MTTGVPRDTREARGSALISAIVLLVLVGIVGIILLHATRIDVRTSLAGVRTKEAFYIAEAGLEMARDQLRLTHAASSRTACLDDAVAAAAGPNGAIDFSPDALRVVYDVSGRPTGFSGYGDDIPLRPFTAFASGAYAAFLTYAPAGPTPGGPVLVTAVGAGSEGAFQQVQAIVEATAGFPMREIGHRKP